MRSSIALLLILAGFCFSSLSFAQAVEPVITQDVHVLKNTTPSQCPASWKGTANAADLISNTPQGVDNSEIVAGILSCVDCSFDKSSGDCVCKTCYGDYN